MRAETEDKMILKSTKIIEGGNEWRQFTIERNGMVYTVSEESFNKTASEFAALFGKADYRHYADRANLHALKK